MDRDRKNELWRAGEELIAAIAAVDGPYSRMQRALMEAHNFRLAAIDDEPLWGCEGCEGYVWDDDGHAATSEDGLHFCGECVRQMERDGAPAEVTTGDEDAA